MAYARVRTSAETRWGVHRLAFLWQGPKKLFTRVWAVLSSPESLAGYVLLAVGLSVLALILAYGAQRRVEVQIADDLHKEDVEFILERANDAVQFADTILSWIEAASVIIGVLIAVAAYMFRASVQRQITAAQNELYKAIEESRAFVTQARQTQDSREQRLDDLDQTLRQQGRDLEQRLDRDLQAIETRLFARIDQSVAGTEARFEAVQASARDAFRVLSLQLLAEQQVRAHNVQTAIKTLQAALAIDPDDHASNYLLGYLHTSRQEIDQALEHLRRALVREPEFVPAIAAMGLALRRRGDAIDKIVPATDALRAERNEYWAQAEAHLLRALRQDGSLTDADGESYFGTLGGLYRRQKRYDDALAAYERAHKVTPDKSYPVINLAALHAHQGNAERAAYFFDKVIEKARLELDDDPRNAWARCDLAQALLVKGEQRAALEQMQMVIGQNPGSGVLGTVLSGLEFLAESPTPIPGLEALIALVRDELARIAAGKTDGGS